MNAVLEFRQSVPGGSTALPTPATNDLQTCPVNLFDFEMVECPTFTYRTNTHQASAAGNWIEGMLALGALGAPDATIVSPIASVTMLSKQLASLEKTATVTFSIDVFKAGIPSLRWHSNNSEHMLVMLVQAGEYHFHSIDAGSIEKFRQKPRWAVDLSAFTTNAAGASATATAVMSPKRQFSADDIALFDEALFASMTVVHEGEFDRG
jgi:hypothetical protein